MSSRYILVCNDLSPELVSFDRVIEYAKNLVAANPEEVDTIVDSLESARTLICDYTGEGLIVLTNTQYQAIQAIRKANSLLINGNTTPELFVTYDLLESIEENGGEPDDIKIADISYLGSENVLYGDNVTITLQDIMDGRVSGDLIDLFDTRLKMGLRCLNVANIDGEEQNSDFSVSSVYWNDPTGKTSALHTVDWSLPSNDIVGFLSDTNVVLDPERTTDLSYLQGFSELSEFIVSFSGGECNLSELHEVDSNTSAEPLCCPQCGGDDLDCGSLSSDAGIAYRDASCKRCEFNWVENFNFSFWEKA